MGKHLYLGPCIVSLLRKSCILTPKDLGADAHLSGRGMHFYTNAWEVGGIGHLCVMRMKAFAGLMTMETVILAPAGVDAPLFNIDRVRAFGKETLLAEFYDTQLAPWPQEVQETFRQLGSSDADLEDYDSGSHWYDSLLYDCSYHRKSRDRDRFDKTAYRFLKAYVKCLADAPQCSPSEVAEKKAKISAFARQLAEGKGPAVSMFEKLFGPETATRMVVRQMYGAE